jgi:crotonobetainyl-CoA:carnitine CoA-transferase CaiB-like acyl-CoA transferase
VATALLYRERTGKGQHFDLSLLDSYFHYLDGSVEVLSASRGEVKVRRTGNTVAASPPQHLQDP